MVDEVEGTEDVDLGEDTGGDDTGGDETGGDETGEDTGGDDLEEMIDKYLEQDSAFDDESKDFDDDESTDDSEDDTENPYKQDNPEDSAEKQDDLDPDDPFDIKDLDVEEDLEDELGIDYSEMDDTELATAARVSETWEDYISQAKDEERDIDDSFFAMAIRKEISPQMLSENSIYNQDDFIAYVQELAERTDPSAIVFPKDGTKEEIADFYEKHENIPKEEEGYTEELFQNTVFEKNDGAKGLLRQKAYESSLTKEQARYWFEVFHNERSAIEQQAAEELKEYAREQRAAIEETYGQDYKTRNTEIARMLNKNFPELLSEMEGTKLYYSKAFFDAMSKIVDQGTDFDQIDFKEVNKGIAGLSNEKLDEMLTKAAQQEYFDEKFLKDPKPSIRKEARKAFKRYEFLEREAEKRGII